MKKYKYKNYETENPFEILSKTDLLDNNCKFNKDIKLVVDIDKVKDLTLADFVNGGVDFLIDNTKNNVDTNLTDDGGDSAKIGSSGYYAQIGSSGCSAQIGSSGDYAQIGSSGYSAKIGSSGDYAKIGSSGDYAKIGSSGDYAKIGSSGDSAKIGSSGDYAKIGSSGDYAKIGSSGDSAKIDITGSNSISFACGYNSIIRGVKGTWFSLAEYQKNNNGSYIPIYAKSGQIGNTEYLDYKGHILKEDYYYILVNKEFTPVLVVDGDIMVILSKKQKDNITLYKTQYLMDFKENKDIKQYVASNGNLFAHGETLQEAINDLHFKILKSQDVQEHIKRVCEQGYMTAQDYRLITGACQYGTNKWLEENGYTWGDKKPIEEVLELVKGEYGYQTLKENFEKYKKE